MPRNYRHERDAVIRKWWGGFSQPANPKPHRSWNCQTITPADCLGIPTPVNSPYDLWGYCMLWKYGLNTGGYGIQSMDGQQELAHRAVFIQTRGQIPEDKQVNHLCNRPYCVQPSHLYAGTRQDNKDDAQIFHKHELFAAPWVMHRYTENRPDDPFLQRLLDSDRYDGTMPWNPVEAPRQQPLEEFSCPGHDFDIPVQGGETKVCRICETMEMQERRLLEDGAYSLIADMCPVSQTVIPVFDKIAASEFVRDSHQEMRRKAYYRGRGPGLGSHDLRVCECDYCRKDRDAFRAAIQPVLTKAELTLLDSCDVLEPQITATLIDASAAMMDTLATQRGLDAEQSLALRKHVSDCDNTKSELVGSSRHLERQLGYFLHAVVAFESLEEMLEDQQLMRIAFRRTRGREEDREPIRGSVLPLATEMADRLVVAWQKEATKLAGPLRESKAELYEGAEYLMSMLAYKEIVEHLRHELLGRNSSYEGQPHPHSACVASIVETGQVDSFPEEEFKEGKGYTPRE